MSRDNRYHEEDSGVSPIVATMVLILATLIVGGITFVAFRSQSASLSNNVDIKIQSADMITTSSDSLFSVAVKNSGTVSLDRIEVYLPGLTKSKSYSSSDFSGGTHRGTVSGSLKLASDYPKLRVFDNPTDGSEDTGTPISNVQELQNIQNNLGGDYYLTQDIDASETKNWNNGKGFDPIGGGESSFSGTFDGNGHIIKNLYIRRSGYHCFGLFGTIRNSLVKNVGLLNVDVTVHKEGNYTGGLVGRILGGSVNNCYSTGSVTRFRPIGGLIGCNAHGDVRNCYSTAEVTGSEEVGGLIGSNYYANVSNSYSAGGVSCDEHIGGLSGGSNGSEVTNCFWDVNTSGQTTSAGGTGLTTEEMKTKSIFTNAGWDFQNTWRSGSPKTGKWISKWLDLGASSYSSLHTNVSISGSARASVKVQVSKNKSKVLCETNFVKLKDGFNKINLKSLPAARYARVVYKLVRGSTPVVENYRLNYTALPTISLGSSKPGQTLSDFVKLPTGAAFAGEKQIVVITGFRENKVVLKKTITVTAHG